MDRFETAVNAARVISAEMIEKQNPVTRDYLWARLRLRLRFIPIF